MKDVKSSFLKVDEFLLAGENRCCFLVLKLYFQMKVQLFPRSFTKLSRSYADRLHQRLIPTTCIMVPDNMQQMTERTQTQQSPPEHATAAADSSRTTMISTLRQLCQERQRQRQHVEDLFQRKTDAMEQQAQLMEQLKQIQSALQSTDRDMEQINHSLLEMDDHIASLEERLGGVDGDSLVVVPSAVPSTAREEFLTDPMTQYAAGNVDDDDDGDPVEETVDTPEKERLPLAATVAPTPVMASLTGRRSSSSTTTTAPPRPQLVLQPVVNQKNRSSSSKPSRQSLLKSTDAASTSGISFSKEKILQTLQQTFRIPSFREHQLDIIQTTLSEKDCFVIMRTGGGKSLLYQLPVVLERPKITLVISPLLSLMQDQQDQMNAFCTGVSVSFHSGLTKTEQASNWRRVRDPSQGVGMILVTPERVYKSNQLKSELQNLYGQNRLARIVIDECHCCCQWGHDFRPDYAKLGVLRQTFGRVPILAVTATASDRVREDVARILQLRPQHAFFRSTGNRPNLCYKIQRKEGSAQETLEDMVDFILTKHPQSAGIVYTRTKKEADTVASQLQECGIPAAAYHSEVSPTKKQKVHNSWMQNKTQVVVATIAFGLGINKPDVRFVIHHSMSKTLEAYYQESGRAGRDGNPADCLLLYSPKDVPKMIGMVHGEQSAPLTKSMIQYAQEFGSDTVCRSILLQNLGEATEPPMEQILTDYHISVPSRDITRHAQTVLQLLFAMQDEKTTMPMLVKEWRSKNSLYECVSENPPSKDLSVFECEYIVVALLLQQLITTDVQYTAYDLVVYLRCTPRAEQFLISDRASFAIRLPPSTKAKATPKRRTSLATTGEWLETRKLTAKRKRPSNSSASGTGKKKQTTMKKKKATSTKAKSSKTTKTKKKSANASQAKISAFTQASAASSSQPEIIELSDDDGESEEDIPLAHFRLNQSPAKPIRKSRRSSTTSHSLAVGDDSDSLMKDSSEEEYEFHE